MDTQRAIVGDWYHDWRHVRVVEGRRKSVRERLLLRVSHGIVVSFHVRGKMLVVTHDE